MSLKDQLPCLCNLGGSLLPSHKDQPDASTILQDAPPQDPAASTEPQSNQPEPSTSASADIAEEIDKGMENEPVKVETNTENKSSDSGAYRPISNKSKLTGKARSDWI
ncbi:hypothetical protein NQ317_019854 [Molorchus minor]|uniref:Uncharacterized protein n=1 Tax=Molorchus minor TaxID=1323400 RepID=A0ABQ9JZS6_9CUCU|nr:hypothetical protein NQ317_019854 [Molorchus minor]